MEASEDVNFMSHFMDRSNDDKSGSECDAAEQVEVHLDYASSDEEIDLSSYDWDIQTNDSYIGRDKTTKWSRTPCQDAEVFPIQLIKQEVFELNDELDAFLKFINPEMIDMITEYTNMHITQERTKHNRERDASTTTKNEVTCLLGILYLLGTMRAKDVNVKELWHTDGTGIEILRAAMSYKRFYFLIKSLRFDDERTRPIHSQVDKLAEIRPIFDPFVNNCKTFYQLGEQVTFGEILAPFRGKCGLNQYVPDKAARYGLKLNVLCDTNSYYVGNLEISCVDQFDNSAYYVSINPKDIVLRLAKPIENSGRNITVGRRYTSYQLARALLKKKITLVGQLKNKQVEVPPHFTSAKNNIIGSTLYAFQKDVTLLSYVPEKDKTIILLSTKHHDVSSDLNVGSTNAPQIFIDYQNTHNAVDIVEEMCGQYTVMRRARRWPQIIFFTMMNIAGINAQILYETKATTKLERRLFLKHLSLKLMTPHLRDRALMKTLPSDIMAFLSRFRTSEPQVDEMEVEVRKGRKRGRCKPCGRSKDITTTLKCSKCFIFACKRHSEVVCTACLSKAAGSS